MNPFDRYDGTFSPASKTAIPRFPYMYPDVIRSPRGASGSSSGGTVPENSRFRTLTNATGEERHPGVRCGREQTRRRGTVKEGSLVYSREGYMLQLGSRYVASSFSRHCDSDRIGRQDHCERLGGATSTQAQVT